MPGHKNAFSWLEIRDEDLSFLEYFSKWKIKKYNVVYAGGSAQWMNFDDGWRQDGIAKDSVLQSENLEPYRYDIIIKNPDKLFLFIVDHGDFVPEQIKDQKNCEIFQRKFLIGNYNPPATIKKHEFKQKKDKWMMCMMGRSNYWRTQLFTRLIRSDLQKEMNLSYLCFGNDRNDDPNERYYDKKFFLRDGGDPELSDLLPFNNFESEIKSNKQRHHGLPLEAMNRSLFALILETGDVCHEAWYTGHTLNMISNGLFPLILSSAHSISQLEGMGFEIPDFIDWRLWDHWNIGDKSRDKIKVCLGQIDNLIKTRNLDELSEQWYPVAQRNIQHFNEKCKDLFRQEDELICEWILTAIGQLSNPRYQKLFKF